MSQLRVRLARPTRARHALPVSGMVLLLAVATVGAPTVSAEPVRLAATAIADSSDRGSGAQGVTGAVSRDLESIHWLHAQEHADDEIAFEPGGKVGVPFAPRAGDAWTVDGVAPRSLPAGEASGREMRRDHPAPMHGAEARAMAGAWDPAVTEDDVEAPASDLGALADPAAWSPGTRRPGSMTAPIGANGLRREVFGFLPYWELTDSSTTLDWRTLSTVAYFSVGCTGTGGLDKRTPSGAATTGWAGWTSSKMTSIINAAHAHQTRVVLTVTCMAWSGTGAATQAALLGSAARRATLARQIAAAVRDRGADGVNLDFEPIVAGASDEFTALVRKIRAELNRVAPGYQLTFDAMGSIDDQPIAAATAPGGADAVLIMGYDYRTEDARTAGSIDPLGGPLYDLTDTIEAYTARISPSKVILGVPYYGRAWSTVSSAVHAQTLPPGKYGGSAAPLYTDAVNIAAANGRRWDPVEQSAWTAYRKQTCTAANGCVTSWRQLYYDDATSLRRRYDLVNHENLRGVGIWALGYDGARPELRKALADKFLARQAPATPIRLVSFTTAPSGPTTASMLTFTLRFGAAVRWLRSGDFVRTGTAAGCKVGVPSGSGAVWTVKVSACGQGTVRLSLKAGAVADAAGNWGPDAGAAGPIVVIDRSGPSASGLTLALRDGVALSSAWTSTGLPTRVTWSGSDSGPSGIRDYDVRRSVDGGAWRDVATHNLDTELWQSLMPGHAYRYAVRARDRAGNIGRWVIGPSMPVVLRQADSGAISYQGAWRLGTAPEYGGGEVRFATAAGASVWYPFTGRSVALITTRRPDAGSVKVYVDGSYVRTIDLGASRLAFRQVVFTRTWTTAGNHTLRLVVAGAAAGHNRVDLDAIGVLR